MQTRRTFLKKSCVACLSLSTFGILLDACSTQQVVVKTVIDKNRLSVPLEKFLQTTSVILRNGKLAYDILVVKQNETFSAVQMRCTHNDVALSFTGKKIVCNAHGSEFDLAGKVIKEPASISLTTYKTSINEQQLLIHLN